MLRRITLVLLMIASPALAQKSQHRLDELAAVGRIDENAPVRASSQILILAPIDKVWKLLSAINDWPRWQSTISSARTSGPLQPGTEFIWIMGGTKIKSRLALVVSNADLAWTGTDHEQALGPSYMKAIKLACAYAASPGLALWPHCQNCA